MERLLLCMSTLCLTHNVAYEHSTITCFSVTVLCVNKHPLERLQWCKNTGNNENNYDALSLGNKLFDGTCK